MVDQAQGKISRWFNQLLLHVGNNVTSVKTAPLQVLTRLSYWPLAICYWSLCERTYSFESKTKGLYD